jgi:hypothetical protein
MEGGRRVDTRNLDWFAYPDLATTPALSSGQLRAIHTNRKRLKVISMSCSGEARLVTPIRLLAL